MMNRKDNAFTQPLRAGAGFTLIELLLVAVLLAVVAGLSVPNLSKLYSTFQFRTAARHISYLMRYAQSLAIIHQKEYRLCFSVDRAEYWLEEEAGVEDPAGVDRIDGEKNFQRIKGSKGRIFVLPKDLVLKIQNDTLLFYPDATMDKAEILLINSTQKEIIISTQERRGQIDIFTPFASE